MQQDYYKNLAENKQREDGKAAGQEYSTQTDGTVLLLQRGGSRLIQERVSCSD